MMEGVAQKLGLPCPLQVWNVDAYKSIIFVAREFCFVLSNQDSKDKIRKSIGKRSSNNFMILRTREHYTRYLKTGRVQKLAINKKSIIFVQSSWNLGKTITWWVFIFTKFHKN